MPNYMKTTFVYPSLKILHAQELYLEAKSSKIMYTFKTLRVRVSMHKLNLYMHKLNLYTTFKSYLRVTAIN